MTNVRVLLVFTQEENESSLDTFSVKLDENESLTEDIKADILQSYFQNSKRTQDDLVRLQFNIES